MLPTRPKRYPYLTHRAQLARMPLAAAREREIACNLDYLHSLVLQPRYGEIRRELRQLSSNPVLLASPRLFARHRVLYAIVQNNDYRGDIAAERLLRDLIEVGDAVPIGERSRAKAQWAERRRSQGDFETSLRLSVSAFADAETSGDTHLLALGQREYTAMLLDVGKFDAAAKALERFSPYTPLLSVQRLFTHAVMLHKTASLTRAQSAYKIAADAAQAAGMIGYANPFNRLAASIAAD